jgi:hypothetical protein
MYSEQSLAGRSAKNRQQKRLHNGPTKQNEHLKRELTALRENAFGEDATTIKPTTMAYTVTSTIVAQYLTHGRTCRTELNELGGVGYQGYVTSHVTKVAWQSCTKTFAHV